MIGRSQPPQPSANAVARLRERMRFLSGLAFLGVQCLIWLPLASLLLLIMPKRQGGRLGRRAIHSGMRCYLGWLEMIGACDFDLSALDRLRDRGALILIANHPVLIDAPLIVSRLPNVVCVMKTSLLNNPLLGAAARLARYVPGEPVVGMVLTAVESLRDGNQLLLFPEATRTSRQPIDPFTPATALIAKRANVKVQTLFIDTDSAYMGKGWSLFRQPEMPIHYRVRLGQCFEPETDTASFTHRLEAYFAAHVSPLDERSTAK